jgi:hypothetical protein
MPENKDTNDVRMVKILEAFNEPEIIHYKMMLNQTGLPYMVRNEPGFGTYSIMPQMAYGPTMFLVPEQYVDEAHRQLADQMEVHASEVPAECPACGASNPQRRIACPECGLFLG